MKKSAEMKAFKERYIVKIGWQVVGVSSGIPISSEPEDDLNTIWFKIDSSIFHLYPKLSGQLAALAKPHMNDFIPFDRTTVQTTDASNP